jgi:hypothetical protein
MRIDDILNIIDGELVNAGFISEIAGFADNLKDLKGGYLFISDDDQDIQEAIKKGAYAILSAKYHKIIDNEISWIKVDSVKDALYKLLKYKLLNKTLYFCDIISYEIIKSMNKDSRLLVFNDFNVKYLEDYDYYLTSNSIFKDIANSYLEKQTELDILDSTLFSIKIRYKKEYNLIFPSLYSEELSKALSFFESNQLKFSLKSLKIDRLYPTFINKSNEIVKFGTSDRVVISGIKKDEYLTKDLNFIFEKAKYANVKFYDITNIDNLYSDKFNFAILLDTKIKLKVKKNTEQSLF